MLAARAAEPERSGAAGPTVKPRVRQRSGRLKGTTSHFNREVSVRPSSTRGSMGTPRLFPLPSFLQLILLVKIRAARWDDP